VRDILVEKVHLERVSVYISGVNAAHDVRRAEVPSGASS